MEIFLCKLAPVDPHHRQLGRPKSAAAWRHPRRQPRKTLASRSFVTELASASVFVAVISWTMAPQIQSLWTLNTSPPEQVEAIEQSVYYNRCDEARAAGAAPIYRGSPGYRDGLDGDDDGIACEPYPR